MDESLCGMFKLTDLNYFLWKLKVTDMLVSKDMRLPVQYGRDKLDKVDAWILEGIHLKASAYMRCFIDMSPCNNFHDETEVDVL
mgnify:CR=1 FL=1